MKPNPLRVLDDPSDWPANARKPNGEIISRRDAWATMSFAGLSMLVIDVPGMGETTPYSNVGGFDDFEIPEDTEGLMSREDLESTGYADSTLEAWARDKHGITIDLSGTDTVDLQAIRGDAYRRFNAEIAW